MTLAQQIVNRLDDEGYILSDDTDILDTIQNVINNFKGDK